MLEVRRLTKALRFHSRGAGRELPSWRGLPLVFDDQPDAMFTTLAILPK